MVTVQDRVNLGKSESARLNDYLTGLPPEAWSQASACDLWQVRDVVAHLTWAAEGFAESISRGVAGDAPAQVPHDFPADAANVASLSEYIARSAIAHREALGDQLLAAFITSTDRLNQIFEGLGSEDWDKPCSFLSRPRTPEAFLLTRVPELAIHEWDIRSRFEPAAALSPDSLPALMERAQYFVGWSFHPGPRLSEPLRYRFELTDRALAPKTSSFKATLAAWNPQMMAPLLVCFDAIPVPLCS